MAGIPVTCKQQLESSFLAVNIIIVSIRHFLDEFPENILVVNNFEEALYEARNDSNPFIIGGGEVYKSGIMLAEKIELTRVHENFDGDTFFPKIDSDTWTLINRVENSSDERHLYNYTFETYIKKL